jgi:Arc/MetJ-type ribon-helix-helix transcriptional regulator
LKEEVINQERQKIQHKEKKQWSTTLMPKVSVEIPQELLDDLNRHVGDNKKFVSQSDAIRTSIRKMLDMMDDIDRRRGRLNE